MGTHLVGLDSRLSRLVAIDLASGKTVWTYRGLSSYASLVVARHRLLALSNDGMLHVLAVSPQKASRERVWRVASGDTWAHLALIGGRFYLKDAQRVLCYELAAP
jgi:hypothetical protein